jgi:hypothetical protein
VHALGQQPIQQVVEHADVQLTILVERRGYGGDIAPPVNVLSVQYLFLTPTRQCDAPCDWW